jgi:4-hydroxy-tetrahydrodipicolinate synthase
VIWPPYFSGYTDDAILDHYRAIADATAFPVIAYNAPEMCGYALSPDLIARLEESGSIAGLKDSSAMLHQVLQTLSLTQGRLPVFQGIDILFLPSLLMGTAGSFCSRANVIPRFMVDFYNTVRAGKTAEAHAMQATLHALACSKRLRRDLWQLMKRGLAMQGVPVGDVCRPRFSPPFDAADLAELRRLLATFGITPREGGLEGE